MRSNVWQVEYLPLCELKHATRNARTHSEAQVAAIRRSIERFGFITPVLIDDRNTIIAGHARVAYYRASSSHVFGRYAEAAFEGSREVGGTGISRTICSFAHIHTILHQHALGFIQLDVPDKLENAHAIGSSKVPLQ
jgi:hypothetical protein